MTKVPQVLVLILLFASLVSACTPQGAVATPKPAPQATLTQQAPQQIATVAPRDDWRLKWDSMVEGAKKEGKVVMYSGSGAEIRTVFQRGFKEKFGINAEFITGRPAEIGPKILAERRANLHLTDVLMGAGTSVITVLKPAGVTERLDVGNPLILPEFSDPKLWLYGGLQWQDSEHMSLAYARYESPVVSRNSEQVKESEIQSYNDLLNPKWKGKIIMRDPTKAGGGLKAIAMRGRYSMGWDWVRALAKQEPAITNDNRQQAEWLARGKYPLAYGLSKSELYVFKQLGLPVEIINVREGGHLTCGTGNVSWLKDVPHPNAARLFLNWLLTNQAQTDFTRAAGYPSIRLDVSDEGLDNRRPSVDSKAPDADTEEAILKQDEDLEIVKAIFLPLMQK